jgi:FkbM family methyltransferase
MGGLPEPWRQNANKIKFVLNFEPNESPRRGPNFMTYNTAVWESEETRQFYLYKGFNATGSSLFKQNYEYVRSNFEKLKNRGPKDLAETWFDRSELIGTIELKCRTIDSILRDEFSSVPFHFMKIDAQGAEYNILKGSESLLSESCVGLHLELFTLPLYEGIVLLDDVEVYLSKFGFKLVKKWLCRNPNLRSGVPTTERSKVQCLLTLLWSNVVRRRYNVSKPVYQVC